MIFYFDVSALNRSFDNQTFPRIQLEAEAVLILLDQIDKGLHHQVSSEMALVEIKANPDRDIRRRLLALLSRASDIMPFSESLFARALELEKFGFKPADALHVAAAETWTADILFSCDDKLCTIAKRNLRRLHVRVLNPLTWIEENMK